MPSFFQMHFFISAFLTGIKVIMEWNLEFCLRPFHECTVNMGNTVRHQISNTGAMKKKKQKNSKELNDRQLTRIFKRHRRAKFPETPADFNVGH